MKNCYEMIWEIFNNCSGNQMRDVHFEEVETDDPEGFVLSKFDDSELTCEVEQSSDGSHVYNLNSHGLRQRVSFTKI